MRPVQVLFMAALLGPGCERESQHARIGLPTALPFASAQPVAQVQRETSPTLEFWSDKVDAIIEHQHARSPRGESGDPSTEITLVEIRSNTTGLCLVPEALGKESKDVSAEVPVQWGDCSSEVF